MANVVLPKVRMFIPCVGVDLDPKRPVVIYSPLHTIRMAPGIKEKYLLDEMWFYVVLTDAVGAFRLSVELFGTEDVVLRKSKPENVTFVGGTQLNAKELRLPMKSVPFPHAGLYEFRLLANHAPLDGGVALLRMLPG